MTLSNAGVNTVINTATAAGLIVNDDVAPDYLSLSASSASKNEGNSGTTSFTFTVSRTGNTAGSTSVNYAVTGSGSNPASANDFSGSVLPSGNVSFAAGETSKTITVLVAGDTSVESDEGFTVTLSNAGVNTVINTATAAGLIVNDDVAPDYLSLSASSASKNEGNSGTTSFTFTVTRTGNTAGSTSVNYAVTGSGSNPASASDFSGSVLPSGSVSFAAGETSKTITVLVAGDTSVESDEGFTVTLSNAGVNTVINSATASGLIANDDAVNVQIIDDTDSQGQFTTVGGWGAWNQAGYSGDYRYSAPGTGNAATWTFQVTPGTYRIAGTWIAQSNHATNTPLSFFDGASQLGSLAINQRTAPSDFTENGANWQNLGVFSVSGSTLRITMTNNANNAVIADAMRIERIGDYQVIDDGSSGFTTNGAWGAWDQAGYAGDYRYSAPGTGNTATWTFQVTPGTYRIAGTWIAQNNHATNTPLAVYDGTAQIGSLSINQRKAPNDFTENGAGWDNLGVFSVSGSTLSITMSNNANNAVIADAMRIERVGDYQIVDDGSKGFSTTGGWGTWDKAGYASDYRYSAPGAGNTATWTFAVTPGIYKLAGTWIAQGNHATNTPLTILDGNVQIGSLTINQRQTPDDFNDGLADWEDLGVFYVSGTQLSITMTNSANNAVIADAMRAERIGDYQLIDDGGSGFSTTGAWGTWNQAGYYGDYRYSSPNIGSSASWSFAVAPGAYDIAGTWVAQVSHASNAKFEIYDGATYLGVAIVDQSQQPDDIIENSKAWESLGTYVVNSNSLTVKLIGNADRALIADAVRIKSVLPSGGSSAFESLVAAGATSEVPRVPSLNAGSGTANAVVAPALPPRAGAFFANLDSQAADAEDIDGNLEEIIELLAEIELMQLQGLRCKYIEHFHEFENSSIETDLSTTLLASQV